jgi:uncharacterized membrane protein YkvA (DUF1232 family)
MTDVNSERISDGQESKTEVGDITVQKETGTSEDMGLKKVLNTAKLVVELVVDYARGRYKQAPWRTIAAAILAIVYIINPLDIIPDFLPGVGWIDDIAILGLLMSGVSHDLKDYCRFKGAEPDECGLTENKN